MRCLEKTISSRTIYVVKTTSGHERTTFLDVVNDYLLWYREER